MARGKKSPLVCRRVEEEKKKWDEAMADHVRLETVGELPSVTISWKNKKRSVELVRLLAGNNWEVVKDLRDESKLAIVCPVCTLEITARGRLAPSIVPYHLFPVHLERIHHIEENLQRRLNLTCPTCKKVPGQGGVTNVENHYEHGGCCEEGGEEEGINDGTMRKGIRKRELMRLVMELQVWEVERIRPGQILVACPVCKLQKSWGLRVHESMVKSNQFKNHFKQEHRKIYFLLGSRLLKCPICQEMVAPGSLRVHFGQDRPCEKAVPFDKVEASVIKEEGSDEVKMEVDGDPKASTCAS